MKTRLLISTVTTNGSAAMIVGAVQLTQRATRAIRSTAHHIWRVIGIHFVITDPAHLLRARCSLVKPGGRPGRVSGQVDVGRGGPGDGGTPQTPRSWGTHRDGGESLRIHPKPARRLYRRTIAVEYVSNGRCYAHGWTPPVPSLSYALELS